MICAMLHLFACVAFAHVLAVHSYASKFVSEHKRCLYDSVLIQRKQLIMTKIPTIEDAKCNVSADDNSLWSLGYVAGKTYTFTNAFNPLWQIVAGTNEMKTADCLQNREKTWSRTFSDDSPNSIQIGIMCAQGYGQTHYVTRTVKRAGSDASGDDTAVETPQNTHICLHGGGGFAGFDSMMQGFSCDFIDAGNVWYADPLNKDTPTTDPDHASRAIRLIDDLIERNGKYRGIIGYSQGAAMALVYISRHPEAFDQVLLIAGYIPTTHKGLTDLIVEGSPYSIESAHVYAPTDILAAPGASSISDLFCRHRIIEAKLGGHAPLTDQQAREQAIAFTQNIADHEPCPSQANEGSTYDYIIVGAGPGGLSAAHTLTFNRSSDTPNVLVLDAGPPVDDQYYTGTTLSAPFFTSVLGCTNTSIGCAPFKEIQETDLYSTYGRVGGQQVGNGAVYAPSIDEDADVQACTSQFIQWEELDATHKGIRRSDRGMTAVCPGASGTCSRGLVTFLPQSGLQRRSAAYTLLGDLKRFEVISDVTVTGIDPAAAAGEASTVKTATSNYTATKGVILAAGALGTARLMCGMGYTPRQMHNHFYWFWMDQESLSRPTVAVEWKDMWFDSFEVTAEGCSPQEFELQLAGNRENKTVIRYVVMIQMKPVQRYTVICDEYNKLQLDSDREQCDIDSEALAVKYFDDRYSSSMSLQAWQWMATHSQAYHWGGGWPDTVPDSLHGADTSMVPEPTNSHMSLPSMAAGSRLGLRLSNRQASDVCKTCTYNERADPFLGCVRCEPGQYQDTKKHSRSVCKTCTSFEPKSTAVDMLCCKALIASCMACSAGVSIEAFCSDARNARYPGCENAGPYVCVEEDFIERVELFVNEFEEKVLENETATVPDNATMQPVPVVRQPTKTSSDEYLAWMIPLIVVIVLLALAVLRLQKKRKTIRENGGNSGSRYSLLGP